MVTRTFAGYRPEAPEEYRDKGITNASEQLPDYEGVIFGDGSVVVRWRTAYCSTSVWASWSDFYHVHGHAEYGTRIDFDDGGPPPAVFLRVGTGQRA
jgi:hypothetical protein